jgi:hypothetical protein
LPSKTCKTMPSARSPREQVKVFGYALEDL